MLSSLALAPVRLAAVAALLLSWLATTNHCGLLLWLGESAAVVECCSGGGDPASAPDGPVEHGQTCCKGLKAPLAEKLTVPAAPEVLPLEAEIGAPPPVLAVLQLAGEMEPVRGPPRAPVLLEQVLRSCQRSTAPPLVA